MNDVRLQGVIATVVTPFDADDRVDEQALRAELRYLLAADVHGICVCGSTGEGNALSAEESARVGEIAVEEVAGRVPVVGGVIQDSTAEVIRYGAAFKAVGIDALQITPIHYLWTPSADETFNYYREIGETLDMPIVIYNVIPWAMIDVDLVVRLADLPHVVAIKQSGGDMHKLADLIMRIGDRISILSAVDDLLYPSFALGAQGTLAAIQTVAPHLVVALWHACQRGDHAEALRLHKLILPIWRAVEGPNMPSRVKEA
ncbi:MAG: dihydrodipicolinate synthase family protein, partial [Chloroflexi bacterium]